MEIRQNEQKVVTEDEYGIHNNLKDVQIYGQCWIRLMHCQFAQNVLWDWRLELFVQNIMNYSLQRSIQINEVN